MVTGAPFDQGYGRGLPPMFTPGSKPKKGILYYNSQKRVYFIEIEI